MSESGTAMGESYTIEITGKIMVVAIIFLFMVVVFVLVLHLYAKWFWWSMEENAAPQPLQRRRRRRRFVFAPGQDPVAYENETHQVGLEPSVLKSLPVLLFKPEDFKEGLECAVCLSEIAEGEKLRLLPKCNHGFHVDCIDMWFHSHTTCPLCRNPVASQSSKTTEENNSDPSSSSSSSHEENSSLEPSSFPTNVLVWGNQAQVSSFGVSLEEKQEEGTSQSPQLPSSSSPASSSSSESGNANNSRCHGMLVIDIPSECTSPSLSPSGSRCAEDEVKSPMAATLRSFKRLLSRDKKLSPSSVDVEQAQS